MTEFAWERAFREWAEREGVGWTPLRFGRSGSAEETTAVRLTPAGPTRAVVLALHGAGNDALFGWVGLFKRLLSRSFEIFTWDLEGHGRATATRFAAETAAGWVEAAARRSGAEERGLPLHAVGVSLGGALLLHSLPALPQVASAALLAAPLRIRFGRRAVLGELGLPLLRTLWREREHYGLTGLVPSFGPWKRETYPLRLAADPGPGAFGYVEALNAALDALRLEDAARAARVPVLLVYGGRDRLVPPEQGERLARLLPHSRLLRLPRESHLTAPLSGAATEAVIEWMEGVR